VKQVAFVTKEMDVPEEKLEMFIVLINLYYSTSKNHYEYKHRKQAHAKGC
jgi:hypothetical protein